MKHLVAEEHHPHLKKRAFLELFGLLILLALSYHQRDIIATAFDAIRQSDVFFLALLLFMYWLLLPLTAISYQILARPKKILIRTTMIAQLAASGPGRIIPGGIGHMSISAMHLHKTGLKMQNSIVITVTNNLIGLISNITLVTIAIIYHPTFVETISKNISSQTIFIMLALLATLFSLGLWLSHIRSTKKAVSKINKQAKLLFKDLLRSPRRFAGLFSIAILITVGHVCMLLLAGEALGVHINFSDGLIALSVGVLIGSAVPTPGGLGAVEAGITGALIVLGYNATEATSVALLFRTATYWQPLIPGVFAYLYLRERKLL